MAKVVFTIEDLDVISGTVKVKRDVEPGEEAEHDMTAAKIASIAVGYLLDNQPMMGTVLKAAIEDMREQGVVSKEVVH